MTPETAMKHADWLRERQRNEELTVLGSMLVVMDDEVRRLREERDLFSNAQLAAELRIVELRAMLARVEALPDYWRKTYDDNCDDCAIDLEAALKDEPKTVEAER
jgi:hypothetical protein